MLTLYPRLVASGAEAGQDHDEGCVCYCIAAACVSLLLFVVLAAAVSIPRACLITAAVALLLGLVGWVAPAAAGTSSGPAARRQQQPSSAPAVPRLLVRHRCACGLADAALGALPTFAYEPPPDGSGSGGKPRRSSVLCAVCLEDVQAGEMVRQLPACRHLFHADCVDAWLRAHRTCPLCRCDLSARSAAAAKADALPPV